MKHRCMVMAERSTKPNNAAKNSPTDQTDQYGNRANKAFAKHLLANDQHNRHKSLK